MFSLEFIRNCPEFELTTVGWSATTQTVPVSEWQPHVNNFHIH